MTSVLIDIIRELEFFPTDAKWWSFDIDSPSGPVALTFELRNGELSDGLLQGGGRFSKTFERSTRLRVTVSAPTMQ
jgi:hypothetical protein